MKTLQSLFYIVIVAMILMAIAWSSDAQDTKSQRLLTAINAKREQMSLPPLIYRIGEQLTVEERVMEISYKFALSEDCDCDYESIAGDHSLQMLVNKMTNIRRYNWLHFERDARFAAIAVVEKEGIFYCVVRTYVN